MFGLVTTWQIKGKKRESPMGGKVFETWENNIKNYSSRASIQHYSGCHLKLIFLFAKKLPNCRFYVKSVWIHYTIHISKTVTLAGLGLLKCVDWQLFRTLNVIKLISRKISVLSHYVAISGFFCHSDFTRNQCWTI